jgi:outer membrane protein TolC
MLVLVLAILAAPARAEAPVSVAAVPGATVEEVLAIARRLSPELAARALDTEAAQARVDIAGSLADPMIRITADEIDRTSGPRLGKMYYTVEQEFPLWGKRDLKRAQAGADVARSQADARATEAELVEKVKVAYAQYYQADQALRTTEDLHRVVHDIAQVARDHTPRAAARSRRSTRPKSKPPGLLPSSCVLRRESAAPPRGSTPCCSGRSTRHWRSL